MKDIVIIWAWASWLFLWTLIPEKKDVLFIEQNETTGNKLLLSWKGRCNFSNQNVSKEHYYGDDVERLETLFKNFWTQEMINLLQKNGIDVKEEDNGRLLLASNKSKQLHEFFLKRNEELWHKFLLGEKVQSIKKEWENFSIQLQNEQIETKNLVIACWWKSFPKIGGSDFVFHFANQYWIQTQEGSPGLCWIETKENLSSLSWSSVVATVVLKGKDNKNLYEKKGVVLFTHWWISWPVIFNLTLFLNRYIHNLKDLKIKIIIDWTEITKRLLGYLKAPKNLKNYTMTLNPQSLKDRETAKVMVWWIRFAELTENFELKKIPWCYVIGEAINITWETWGFNLQRCWTSAYQCAKAFS